MNKIKIQEKIKIQFIFLSIFFICTIQLKSYADENFTPYASNLFQNGTIKKEFFLPTAVEPSMEYEATKTTEVQVQEVEKNASNDAKSVHSNGKIYRPIKEYSLNPNAFIAQSESDSSFITCFSTDLYKLQKTLFPPPTPLPKYLLPNSNYTFDDSFGLNELFSSVYDFSVKPPMDYPQPEPEPIAIEEVIDRRLELRTKFWLGVESNYFFGVLPTYIPQFSTGPVVGASRGISKLTTSDHLYVGFNSDMVQTGQNSTINSVNLQTSYYAMNLDIVFGWEHYFNFLPISFYADAGPEIGQKTFVVAAPFTLGVRSSYKATLTYGFVVDFGLGYEYQLTDNIGLLARLNTNAVVGVPSYVVINSSSGAEIDTVDVNPIILRPSFSLGVSF